MKNFFLIFFISIFSAHIFAYQIEAGDSFLGGGLGANVNVLRYDIASREKPKGDMPLLISYDYAIDPSLGFFGVFMPRFAAGSVAFSVHAGAKYWLSSLNAPYVPYLSLAITPAIMLPVGPGVNHYNIGLSPGLGISYFVMANFLIGMGLGLNPSFAFVEEDTKFEFSALGFFEVAFKI